MPLALLPPSLLAWVRSSPSPRHCPPTNAPPADECSAVVTETVYVTVPAGHLPSAPGSAAPTLPPYPTTGAPYPSVAASGTGVKVISTGAAVATGTGAYSAPPSQFTGAASNVQVGGLVAGVGALAALFL